MTRYQEDPEYRELVKSRSKARKKQLRELRYHLLRWLKETTPCADCGQKFPHYIMELDHLRDKVRVVANLAGESDAVFYGELRKCEIVCANCHAVRTHNRRADKNGQSNA